MCDRRIGMMIWSATQDNCELSSHHHIHIMITDTTLSSSPTLKVVSLNENFSCSSLSWSREDSIKSGKLGYENYGGDMGIHLTGLQYLLQ
jgi:hypothetical protein